METESLNIEDPAQFRNYLSSQNLFLEGASFSVLPGGVSSRTVLVQQSGGESWVFKQALPALRVPVEWLSSPERAWREADGARALGGILPRGCVPAITFEDRGRHLFAMTAVPATAPTWKTLLLGGTVELPHFHQCGQLLATLHRESAGRSGLAASFSDLSYFESLRLEPFYEYTAAKAPDAAPFLFSLAASARSERHSLVHGDFSPKNILVDGPRMVLLDHEVIHYGDPAFDIGFLLAHLLSKAHHLVAARARLLDAIAVLSQAYLEGIQDCPWAASLESRAVQHALGCLLARAAGRSQLEYLSAVEREHQIAACVRLIQSGTQSITGLAGRFLMEVS